MKTLNGCRISRWIEEIWHHFASPRWGLISSIHRKSPCNILDGGGKGLATSDSESSRRQCKPLQASTPHENASPFEFPKGTISLGPLQKHVSWSLFRPFVPHKMVGLRGGAEGDADASVCRAAAAWGAYDIHLQHVG